MQALRGEPSDSALASKMRPGAAAPSTGNSGTMEATAPKRTGLYALEPLEEASAPPLPLALVKPYFGMMGGGPSADYKSGSADYESYYEPPIGGPPVGSPDARDGRGRIEQPSGANAPTSRSPPLH